MGIRYDDDSGGPWNPILPLFLFIVGPIIIIISLRGCA